MDHQKSSISLETQEWMNLFPLQVTQSYDNSLTFMKQLTAISFSTITFLKKLFPIESFITQKFEGIELQILKEECEDAQAQIASTALIGSLDALEKKYLEKLVLCLYEGPQHPDNLAESYALSFSYDPPRVSVGAGRAGGAAPVGAGSEADTRARTRRLLEACVLAARSDTALSAQYDLIVRIYYNESRPAWYHASGFAAGAEEGGLQAALADTEELEAVRTPFHRLALNACVRASADSHEANATLTIPSFSEEDYIVIRESQRLVYCACGLEDATDHMLTCSECHTLQHAACFGVRRGDSPALHYCLPCAAAAGRRHTCSQLAGLVTRRREVRALCAITTTTAGDSAGLCVYRRSLAWCSERSRCSAAELRDSLPVPEFTALRILNALTTNGILAEHDGILTVNKNKLEAAMRIQFRSDENSVVERLITESQTQNTTVDPVREVLSPDEVTSLHKAADPGQVVAQPQPEQDDDLDSTLERYLRVVLQPDNTEDKADELPLSGKHNPVQSNTKRKMEDTEDRLGKSRLATKKGKLMMTLKR